VSGPVFPFKGPEGYSHVHITIESAVATNSNHSDLIESIRLRAIMSSFPY
jgi:hypothetical protein